MGFKREIELSDDEALTIIAWNKIVARAWADPAFKAKLQADPASVLKDYGVTPGAGVSYKVVEDTATQKHLVLPPQPVNVSVTPDQRQPLSDFNPGF